MSGKFWLIFILSLIASLLIGWRVVWPLLPQSQSQNESSSQLMRVGKAEVGVEIANEVSEIETGLSGRQSLASDRGMLFVLPSKSKPVFWMKDMNFSLDMIFIDCGVTSSGVNKETPGSNTAGGCRVVDIADNMPAPKEGEEPATYQPVAAVDMVLEVNAGWTRVSGVQIDDKVEFKQ